MAIFLVIGPIGIIACLIMLINEYKKNSYIRTTRMNIRSRLFFSLKHEALENKELNDEELEFKLSTILNKYLNSDKNLKYKILIENNKKRNIKIVVSNGIKHPFYRIDEKLVLE